MESAILMGETQQVKYVVKVNGRIVSVPFTSRHLAEGHISHLPESQQGIAEIVPVTDKGREILLG